MSIFKNILAKIFPTDHPANAPAKPGTGTTGQSTTPGSASAGAGTTTAGATTAGSPGSSADATGMRGTTNPAGGGSSSSAAAPSPTSGTGTTGMPGGAASFGGATAASVDVDAVLRELQSKNTENLNWKTSIVDLLKLLGMDSSMAARRELAAELHYSGSTEDSAAMNMWLHKEVIRKLAENGGKLPEDLRH
ncbi:MAG TPA: DUF3597 domain-containing protein [Candidimonas sp.]|nr:DUF3597 domain-containing protein [Candidimonas sp.]